MIGMGMGCDDRGEMLDTQALQIGQGFAIRVTTVNQDSRAVRDLNKNTIALTYINEMHCQGDLLSCCWSSSNKYKGYCKQELVYQPLFHHCRFALSSALRLTRLAIVITIQLAVASRQTRIGLIAGELGTGIAKSGAVSAAACGYWLLDQWGRG